MKSIPLFTIGLLSSLALASIVTGVVRGEDAKIHSSTSALPVAGIPPEPEIPQAIFVVTNKSLKDPFFPKSTRIKTVTTNAAPTISSSLFVLNGLSGSAEARLAMINGRTVAVGEDAEVPTTLGKMKIHCVEIKESSAVIRIPGIPDPIELRFRM